MSHPVPGLPTAKSPNLNRRRGLLAEKLPFAWTSVTQHSLPSGLHKTAVSHFATKEVTKVTMGTRVPAKQATLPDVDLGQSSTSASVLLVQAPSPDMLPGIDGIIGIAPLKARRIHFDFAGKALSWE
jgi:hypothetical protein